MSVKMRFRGKEFTRRLQNATATGLKRAGVFYHGKCRQEVSTPNTGTRRKRTRATDGGRAGSQYTTYDDSSSPGDPPKLRTGTGRSHIVHEFNGDQSNPAVRVGVEQKGLYMAFLDLGTSRVEPRPWLFATLQKHWGAIAALAATGGKNKIGK
jgi:hypothetical protein